MNQFDQAVIDAYFSAVIADYNRMSTRQDMQDEFRDGLRIEYGKKYAKVIQRHSVHSFIVLQDDPQFKRGDILKAASWSVPAKNFSRGNILRGEFQNVRWTGA